MKTKKLFLLSIPALILSLASCAEGPSAPSSSQEELASSENASLDAPSSEASSEEPFLEDYYSVEEAIALSNTKKVYNVMGVIKSFTNFYHGACILGDEKGNEISVYGLYGEDGETHFDLLEDIPYIGDTVIIQGEVKQFNGTPEMGKSNIRRIYSTHALPNQAEYEASTIASARSASVGKKVKLTGVVSTVTQTQKFSYNGFYLVDGTGSIFVYGGESAVHVKPGNTVTVVGELDHYIADSEATYAAQYGYQGAIQIKNSFVVENNKGQSEFDRSWIKESTMREILETPLSNNITSDSYLVTGFVKKVEGEGFVNYYLDDLDGVTGGRVYTSNSGSDFAYLDKYLDHVVSMVVSPINCKSTISGTEYRFIPLDVKILEDYVFDLSLAPKFALDNMAMDQFEDVYNHDPAFEVETSYSNAALGIENVVLNYSSSDENVVSFKEEDGKTVFHVNATVSSSATITVSATLGEYKASLTKEIAYEVPSFETISIAEAIASPLDSEVTVRGVIAGMTIIKTGFFLVDETGMVAIQLASKDELSKIHVGDEVVVSGKRNAAGVKPDTGYTGQVNLAYSEIKAILGIDKSYCRDNVIESTIPELNATPITQNITTNLYHVSCYPKAVVNSRGYRLLYLYADQASSENDAAPYLKVYSSSDKQWDFMEPLLEKQVSMDLAVCNWNGQYYQAAVLNATDGQTTVVC